ncbi:MAG: hypothetical protein ABI632_04760 [Pseudolysinimonas sp.]
MPFTPSHAAAALPFLRTPLLPAALVICLAWWAARRRLPNAHLPVGDA